MRRRILSLILASVLMIGLLAVPTNAAPIETEEEIIPTPAPVKFTPESLIYDGKLTLTVKASVKDMSKLSGSHMDFSMGNTSVASVAFSSLSPDSGGYYRFVCVIPENSGTNFKAAFVYGDKSITLNGTLSEIKSSTPTCTDYGTKKYSLKFDKVSYGTLNSEPFTDRDAPPKGHSYQDGVCISCGAKAALGDINCDGKINAVDANLQKQIILGTLDKCPQADLNSDNKVNAVDANLLKMIIIGA